MGFRLRNLDLNVSSDRSAIDSGHNRSGRPLKPGPAGRLQHDNCDSSRIQVLLISQIGVRREKDLEAVPFRGIQKFAIAEGRPTALVGGRDFVPYEKSPQRHRRTLIEEDTHLR